MSRERALPVGSRSGAACELRLFAVAAAVFIVFAALLFGSSAPFSIRHVQAMCGQPPPDVRFYTSAGDVHGFLVECGVTGRLAYRSLQLADLFYPAVNGVFMASAMGVMLARIVRRGSLWLALAVLPPLGAAFDYLENCSGVDQPLEIPGGGWGCCLPPRGGIGRQTDNQLGRRTAAAGRPRDCVCAPGDQATGQRGRRIGRLSAAS